jgi:hypothetical protein
MDEQSFDMDEQASFEPAAVLARRRAGWSRLIAIVPALALAATAWLGLSGQRSGAPAATSVPGPIAQSSQGPVGMGTTQIAKAPPDPDFPPAVLGIEVRDVGTLLDDSPPPAGSVAVAGWYAANLALACPPSTTHVDVAYVAELGVDAGTLTFCKRSGLLFKASPQASTEGDASYLDENRFKDTALPALPVTVTPGVVLPPELDDDTGPATPVVMIGRLVTDTDPGCSGPSGCPPSFAVDRVIWADGIGVAQMTSILPSLLDTGPLLSWRPRDRVAESTTGPQSALLMETLVDPRTLAAVDPVAAAMVATNAPKASRLWYRLTLAYDPAKETPRWLVIDDTTGSVIAKSPPGS